MAKLGDGEAARRARIEQAKLVLKDIKASHAQPYPHLRKLQHNLPPEQREKVVEFIAEASQSHARTLAHVHSCRSSRLGRASINTSSPYPQSLVHPTHKPPRKAPGGVDGGGTGRENQEGVPRVMEHCIQSNAPDHVSRQRELPSFPVGCVFLRQLTSIDRRSGVLTLSMCPCRFVRALATPRRLPVSR
eukprot:scaffold88061_cov36-Tisochrysis_lutea.AAC.1